MYQVKKLLVCLDRTEMDETLVRFASFIAEINHSKKIYFINIIRNLNIPKEVVKEFPNLIEDITEERKAVMKKVVQEHFSKRTASECSFVVKEGQLAKKILKFANEKSVDMILVGRKVELQGTGVIAQRLARRTNCSLFIIPEKSNPKIKKILAPSDFSDYSRDAMEEAIAIAEKSGEKVEITCQNVFTVPSGHDFSVKSNEEFVSSMLNHAEASYKKFIRKIDSRQVKVTPVYTKDEDDDPVEDIIHLAKEINADAIVIGAKGRTAASALFLGSMAERLIQMNNKFPLLVSRPKGANAGVVEYILEI